MIGMRVLSLIAAIAVYLATFTRAGDDVLVFMFKNSSVHFNSENLEKFHNCLCDNTSISCSVPDPDDDTVQSRKQSLPDSSDDAYINVYECPFGPGNAQNMNCTRAKNASTCTHDLCHSVCFTNRSSCDLYNVSAVFFFSEMTDVKLDANDTVLHGLCQADEVCSPGEPCGTPASTLSQAAPQRDLTDLGDPHRDLIDSVEHERTQRVAPMKLNYLESEEMDCSNVCPSLAKIVLVDTAVVATAFFFCVCSISVF